MLLDSKEMEKVLRTLLLTTLTNHFIATANTFIAPHVSAADNTYKEKKTKGTQKRESIHSYIYDLLNPISNMTPDGWKKCFQCQKTNTPEWSIEPYGSRTLCNACGLYYRRLIHILKNHFLSRSSLIFVIWLETILSISTNLSSFIVGENNSSNVVHLMIKNFNLIKKKYLF